MSNVIPPSSALPAAAAASASLDAAGVSSASPAASASPGQGGTPAAAPASAATPASAVSGAVPAAQVAPILAAVQAALANTVNLSPQAQQAVKFEAFNQLVASLVNQVQPGKVEMPASWPAGGVAPQLQTLASQLLQSATATQPLPQQLVSLQSWPTALTQAVLQQAGAGAAQPPAAGASGSAGAPTALAAAPAGAAGRPLLPALQTWLVQQGVVQAQDGERAFALTLRVPVAWAQAQAALGDALARNASPPNPAALAEGLRAAMPLPAAGAAAGMAQPAGLAPLPFSGSVQQLASGALGLVMQPQALPGSPASASAAVQAMRTSAILQLEFQPLANSVQTAQAASVYLPAHMQAHEVQAMLQGRGTDPWLLMVQAQADGQNARQPRQSHEQDGLCNRAGCQYQGRAACAQPFCAEMNYLWSVDRARRRS